MTIQAINPATDELIQSYDSMMVDEVNGIIEKANEAFLKWRRTSFKERGVLMKNAGRILTENKEKYARLMAMEMGKPIKEGRAEVTKCAGVCDYYANNAEFLIKPEHVMTEASKSYVAFQPIGLILAVMPWNFPFWQVFRFAAPALMAGNTGILKHASNVPGCALAIENVFIEAGFPEDTFRTLMIGSGMVEGVIENKLVKGVTLTGSTLAGKSVAKKAGELLKKSVLELGGSDAYIVLEDADLEEAVNICVFSRLINSGQSCIAAKRFIVVENVLSEFTELFVKKMKEAKMGDPLLEETGVGPQARRDLRDDLHRQVKESIEKGAKCLLGGYIPEGKGAFYPPTVLADVKKGMRAYDEELFGPVGAIIGVKNEEEAIKVANDTVFGLGGAIFTKDVNRGERLAAEEIESGSCFVNTFVRSDPRLPFGGIKESGYGRELSHYGIKEFLNIKTVYVK